jgi:hypothetical protein
MGFPGHIKELLNYSIVPPILLELPPVAVIQLSISLDVIVNLTTRTQPTTPLHCLKLKTMHILFPTWTRPQQSQLLLPRRIL